MSVDDFEAMRKYQEVGLLEAFMRGEAPYLPDRGPPYLPDRGPPECRRCGTELWTAELCDACAAPLEVKKSA